MNTSYKHNITLLFLILASLPAFSQFRMIGTASWAVVTDSTYSGTINFQVDLTGKGYLATSVVDTFRVFTGTEQIYTITSVGTKTFSSAQVTIKEYNGDHGVPIGQVMVYDPAGKTTLPQAPFGSTGSTAQLQAAVDTYNARLLSAISSLADGDKGDITVSASGASWTIDNNTITGDKISASAVGADEIASGAVGPDELAATSVTPGVYTAANLTIDQDGRIESAADGETLYNGGTFSLGSTHELLETALGGYSTRFRNSAGAYMGLYSDTTDGDFIGLKWVTLRGSFEIGETLSEFRLKFGNDTRFELSNPLDRFYFEGTFDTDDTNTAALAVDPVTYELELVSIPENQIIDTLSYDNTTGVLSASLSNDGVAASTVDLGIPNTEDHIITPDATGALSQRVGGLTDFYSVTVDQEEVVSDWREFNFAQGDEATLTVGSSYLSSNLTAERSGIKLYGSGRVEFGGLDTTGNAFGKTYLWPSRIYQQNYVNHARIQIDSVSRNSVYVPGITRWVHNRFDPVNTPMPDSSVLVANWTVERRVGGNVQSYFDYIWKEAEQDVRYRWGYDRTSGTTEHQKLIQNNPTFEIALNDNYIRVDGLKNTIDSTASVTPINFLYTDATGKIFSGDIDSIAIGGGGGASQLSDLSDVVSATNTNRFALMANGTTGYVGRALVQADVSDLNLTSREIALGTGSGITSESGFKLSTNGVLELSTDNGTGNVGISSVGGAAMGNIDALSDYNVAIGFGAMAAFLNGADNNAALGAGALFSLTTGDKNTGAGPYTGADLTTGSDNFLGGYFAGDNATVLGQSVLIGSYAGSLISSGVGGTGNAVVGHYAGRGLTSDYFVANGFYAATAGANQDYFDGGVAIGAQAGSGLGINNARSIFIGFSAGNGESTYDDLILIGSEATATQSNQIVIGHQTSGYESTQLKVRNYKFNIDQTLGAAQDGDVMTYNNASGEFEAQDAVAKPHGFNQYTSNPGTLSPEDGQVYAIDVTTAGWTQVINPINLNTGDVIKIFFVATDVNTLTLDIPGTGPGFIRPIVNGDFAADETEDITSGEGSITLIYDGTDFWFEEK